MISATECLMLPNNQCNSYSVICSIFLNDTLVTVESGRHITVPNPVCGFFIIHIYLSKFVKINLLHRNLSNLLRFNILFFTFNLSMLYT